MDYFEVILPQGDAVCSDKECPCLEAVILRGTGYLYIDQQLVDFRRDALTVEDMDRKLERMKMTTPGTTFLIDPNVYLPILMYRLGARLRGLVLTTAGADAKHMWQTGKVPLRPTPLISYQERGTQSSQKLPKPSSITQELRGLWQLLKWGVICTLPTIKLLWKPIPFSDLNSVVTKYARIHNVAHELGTTWGTTLSFACVGCGAIFETDRFDPTRLFRGSASWPLYDGLYGCPGCDHKLARLHNKQT